MAGGGGGGSGLSESSVASQFGSFMPRRKIGDDSDFDITAMIDLVFMMNIFFLVTSLTKAMGLGDLPTSSYCVPADENESVVIAVMVGPDPENPRVFIGGDTSKEPVTDPESQAEQIRAAVEKGVAENKSTVLIKAEKNIRLRHTSRISAVITSVEGAKPLYAVLEMDKKE